MLKPDRNAQVKQKTKLGRKKVLPCEVENDPAEQSFDGKKVFFLDNGRRHASRLPICCKKWYKNQLFKRNEKTGRKWLKNFLHCHQEISVTMREVLHSQEQGVSFLNQ